MSMNYRDFKGGLKTIREMSLLQLAWIGYGAQLLLAWHSMPDARAGEWLAAISIIALEFLALLYASARQQEEIDRRELTRGGSDREDP